jgi:hypothetical protein
MTSSAPQEFDRRAALEGLAATAVTVAEMGGSDVEIVQTVRAQMSALGMATVQVVREVIATVAQLPQPPDESADVRERRRPIEDMLGVASPEAQLASAMRARAVLEAFAEQLDSGS